MKVGKCVLCGDEKPLTFEHIPPKSAFNNRGVFEADIRGMIDAGHFSPTIETRTSLKRKGAGKHTLCQSCNNNTGGWYGASYVDMAQQAMAFVHQVPLLRSNLCQFTIHPLRALKQIVAMFCSVTGPSLCEVEPFVRNYLLNREVRGLGRANLHFWLGLYSIEFSDASRQSGMSGIMDFGTGTKLIASEFCFPPLIVVMTQGEGVPDHRLWNIDFFDDYDYWEFADVCGPLWSLPVNSYIPLTYQEKT